MIVNIEQIDNHLKISHINKDGDIEMKVIPIPEEELYNWAYSNRGTSYKSWDNKYVIRHKSRYLNNYRVIEFLAKLPKEETDCLYEFNIPKKYFVDIEVKFDGDVENIKNHVNPIYTIGISHKDSMIVMGLKDLSTKEIELIQSKVDEHFKQFPEKLTFQYIKFNTEYDLLYTFFNEYVPKMPLITGWHFIGFDWNYLVERSKKININPNVASTAGKLTSQDKLPMHRIVCDYLEIYKKWDRVISIKENFKLDTVAESALGIKKVHYNGTLEDLYHTNFVDFVFYNATDCHLVKYIDDKLNTLLTYLLIANQSAVEVPRAFSPIWITENLMVREFLKLGKYVISKDITEARGDYEGAYVKKPLTGLYQWIAAFDFASLYPSIMRQFFISPETYVGKMVGDPAKNPNLIRCSSGATFNKENGAVLETILSNFYSQRKAIKTEAQDIEVEIVELKRLLENNQ